MKNNVPKVGFHTGISEAVYRNWAAANCSTLKEVLRSPLHANEQRLNPKPPLPPMVTGSALHLNALQPELYKDEYATAEKMDRRTKVGKAAWAKFQEENAGKTILSADQQSAVVGMTESLKAQEWYADLFDGPGEREVSIVWLDERTGIRCKARLDLITEAWGGAVIADLKKTQDASEGAVGRAVSRYKYHMQAAFYLDGMATLAKRDRRFIFAFIEEPSPHGCALYELDEFAEEQGRQDYRRALALYGQCLEQHSWPGYPSGVTELKLPHWAIKQDEWVK